VATALLAAVIFGVWNHAALAAMHPVLAFVVLPIFLAVVTVLALFALGLLYFLVERSFRPTSPPVPSEGAEPAAPVVPDHAPAER
jgi:hypothetical protein